MTKEEYLAGILPYEEWKEKHDKYVADAFKDMEGYFDAERFLSDKADSPTCRNIIETTLADAWFNNNYEYTEFDDEISRRLGIPMEDVVNYRTEQFWKEIEEVAV